MGVCSARDLKNLSNAIYKKTCMTTASSSPTDKMIIKKAAISHAINQYLQNKVKLDYDSEDETDEERQNRHHKENMDLQEQHHQENGMLQDQHFVQQQIIQVISSQYTVDPVAFLGGGWKVDRVYDCLSNEQKQIFYKIVEDSKKRNQLVEEVRRRNQE